MRIIVIGAHPDDCEYRFAGTAAMLVAQGHAIKFLSVTNGDAGHQVMGGAALAGRRRAESIEAARRLGIAACEVLDNHDGELLATLDVRREIIRQIRDWQAGLVLTHRPNDYHPDHRYTNMLVQDSAFMVTVPNICTSSPPLRQNPVFMYLEDEFQKPSPFSADVVVNIEAVWESKIDAMDAHESQVYEWLPWLGGTLDQVPTDRAGRREWLNRWLRSQPRNNVRAALEGRYGAETASRITVFEAFELSEYGRQPSREELDRMFSIFSSKNEPGDGSEATDARPPF